MTASAKTLMALRQNVLKIYPRAFGWREFSTSDYTVHSGTGALLASAFAAKDAWAAASTKAERGAKRKGR